MKRILTAAALALAVVACGDDGPTGPDGDSNNSMEASVGGVAFDPPALAVQGSFANGVFTVAGAQTTGGVTTMVSITILGLDGEGDYPLSPNFGGQFGQVNVTQGGTLSTWTTVLSPGTGNVDITTFTDDRIAGTFQFTGQAAPGTAATGQKQVTSGQFNFRR
jgi:hypothetical protein